MSDFVNYSASLIVRYVYELEHVAGTDLLESTTLYAYRKLGHMSGKYHRPLFRTRICAPPDNEKLVNTWEIKSWTSQNAL